MDDARALLEAGYRRVGQRWAKPVGFSLFVYEPGFRRWSQIFRDVKGGVRVYASAEREPTAALGPWLAYVENYEGRLHLPAAQAFHFSTADLAAEVLDA